MKPVALLRNGREIEPSILDSCITTGVGVFETIRVRRVGGDPAIYRLGEHLDRIIEGNDSLVGNQRTAKEDLLRGIGEILRGSWQRIGGECVLRLIVYPEDIFISLTPWRPIFDRNSPIKLASVHYYRQFPEFKTCSSIVSYRARAHANAIGAEEALFRGVEEEILEGAWSNIFFVTREGTLVTPKDGVLKGITRQAVIDLAPGALEERIPNVSEDFVECFITQSTHGVIPVESIDGRVIGMSSPGPITMGLQDKYESLCREAVISI